MLEGLFIIVDDDFEVPIYAEPGLEDLEDGLWEQVCEAVNEALEGDRENEGVRQLGELRLGWRVLLKMGLGFVALVRDDVKPQALDRYLKSLSRAYMDEVDQPRHPEREGVADVVVDVIPPWEEDED